MKRRDHHAYHDFSQVKKPEFDINSPYPNPTWPIERNSEASVAELPEQSHLNERFASLQLRKPQKLVEQISGPELPYTLGISSTSREPVPEIPEERVLAQAAVDEGIQSQFRTFQDTSPPPADCQYEIIDQGVSGPQFLRCSMYNVPYSEKLRKMSQLPLSLYVRPFAEAEVPLADFSQFDGAEIPPRCRRCRAYINPSMRFIDGGARFVCNLCLFVNTTPEQYFQPTGPDGRRLDWEERPELAFGTYDLAVVSASGDIQEQDRVGRDSRLGAEFDIDGNSPNNGSFKSLYGKAASGQFRRVFICESGRDASQKGLVELFAQAIKASLPYMGANERIAIATFNSTIQYYRPTISRQIQMVVTSPDAPIVPPDVFMDPQADKDFIERLLDQLHLFSKGTPDKSSCLGSALETVLTFSDSNEGGRVTTLITSLPSKGPSQLRMRDPAIAGITSPDAPVHKELFEPSAPFYKSLAARLSSSGWGCDILAVPTAGYLDMTNIAPIASSTGGKLFCYPRFVSERDSRRIITDLLSLVASPMQARNTSFRIRTSTGLQIDQLYGANAGSATFMDSQTTIVASIGFDGQLDPKLDAHFQVAVLYTSLSGEKRVRVCNLLTGVTPKLKPVLKFVDCDVVMATITRQTLAQMAKFSIQELRQAVLSKVENIFGAARLHAGQGMPLSQLLMPINLRQLLMFGLALTKSIAIGSRAYSTDARVVSANYLMEATENQLALALYPRIYDIGNGENMLMARARITDLMLGSHTFAVFDGQQIFIWLSELTTPSTLNALFGVQTLDEVAPWLDELPVLETNQHIRQLCSNLAVRVSRSWVPIQIVRQRLDGSEYQLRQLLVEDTINDSPSYINYVVRVHHIAKEYTDKEGWF